MIEVRPIFEDKIIKPDGSMDGSYLRPCLSEYLHQYNLYICVVNENFDDHPKYSKNAECVLTIYPLFFREDAYLSSLDYIRLFFKRKRVVKFEYTLKSKEEDLLIDVANETLDYLDQIGIMYDSKLNNFARGTTYD